MLQICYSNGSNPYLTGLAPVIPPPELRGDGYLQWDSRSCYRLLSYPMGVFGFLLLPK